MSVARPLRVVVIADNPPAVRWHRRVVEAIQAETPDVVVTSTPNISPAPDLVIDLLGVPVTDTPKLGVWRYGFGDGAPVARGARGTLARVYCVGRDSTRGVVLREGWLRASSNDAPGVNSVGECVASWCGLLLRQVTLDPDAFDGAPLVPRAGCDQILPPAMNLGPLTLIREAVGRWRRRERWTIGLATTTIDEVLARREMPEPRWLTGVNANGYLADPFPLAVDGDRVSLLAEELRFSEGRGRIVCVDVARNADVVNVRAVLDAPHHLAYPFIVRDGAAAYCVPDGSAAGQASAYLLSSPHQDRQVLLPDFPAVDPTIVEHGGQWWLFCTRRGVENQTNLYVFQADEWRGPWRPHPLNPVKTDARSSRPAGAFFTRDGALFRPAQDCSRRYGGGVAINRIVELSCTGFREETMCTLRPSPSWQWPDGMHTFNAIEDLVIVDALRVER